MLILCYLFLSVSLLGSTQISPLIFIASDYLLFGRIWTTPPAISGDWPMDVTLVVPSCQISKTQDVRTPKVSGSAITMQERFCTLKSSDSCDAVVAWVVWGQATPPLRHWVHKKKS